MTGRPPRPTVGASARGDIQQDAEDEASILVHWPHRVHRERMRAIGDPGGMFRGGNSKQWVA